MNILILSSGTRNKIVQFFCDAFKGKGKVVAADCSTLAPALYDADKYYIVPRIVEDNYLIEVLKICNEEKIDGVISLIDPELSILAKNKKKFEQQGTMVIGSSYELCEMALDKMQMYHWLCSHSYYCAKSYINKSDFYNDIEKGTVSYPVIVKPVRGSASFSVSKAYNHEDIEFMYSRNKDLMIQEFLDGQEIGIDAYVDFISGEVVSIFAKKKIKMRAGETDKALSFKDEQLFCIVEKFILEAGYRGQIDIDIFEMNGKYYISEVNPRFGGGYPHAYVCGCNHMQMIANNLEGIINERNIGSYDEGVYMMKYNELKICK